MSTFNKSPLFIEKHKFINLGLGKIDYWQIVMGANDVNKRETTLILYPSQRE